MRVALSDLKKFRDGTEREINSAKAKIEAYYEHIGELERIIKKEEQKLAEYNQIIEMVEGSEQTAK